MRAIVGYPPLLTGLAVRTAIVWLGVRALVLAGRFIVEDLLTSLTLIAMVVGVVLIDARVTRELLYVRNLGLSGWWLAAWATLTAALLETIARVVW